MLDVRGVSKTFHRLGRPPVKALDEVYLRVPDGAIVGLVGESGSGKSTLLRCLTRLETPDTGSITVDGVDISRLRGAKLRSYRRRVQMVFQDPAGSLNPRMSVEELITEGMIVHRRGGTPTARRERVAELLEQVGMRPDDRDRYPVSFSGGQLQRIAIARALAVEPSVLICDEPVSALDVSVQAQVLNLLLDMQRDLGLSILFVSHDLAVVRFLCPHIAVLRHGVLIEESTRTELFAHPKHAYTSELIAAIPELAPPSRS